MPQTLAQMVRAKHSGAYDDLSDQELDTRIRAKFPGVYDDLPSTVDVPREPPRKPVSAEDFIPTKTSTSREVAKGVLKGATSSLAGLGEMLANAGMLPGVAPAAFNEDLRHPVFRKAEELTTAANAPQRVGKVAEFAAEVAAPTYQLGKAGIALAQSAPAILSKAGPLVADLVTEALPFGRVARKILGHVLDSAGTKGASSASNAGGRLVSAGSRPSVDAEIAKALDELRAPELPPSVELPPPADLPPGYVPRAEVPPPTPSPNVGGRVVPAQTPSMTQALTDALAEARVPTPPARVTTPPEASLPPGYTPRATAPRPKMVKPERSATPPTTQPARRAYFLKSAEEMAPVVEDAVEPTGSLTVGDLPASWRSHTGQDIFPITGEEGKAVVDAMRAELKDRGLSVGEAIASVSKNRQLPTELRSQLLRALGGGK